MAWFPFGELYDDLKEGPPGPPGAGFRLTDDGNYDMENKLLKNVKDPDEIQDAANKIYVDNKMVQLDENIITAINEFGVENSKILKRLEDEHSKDKKDVDNSILILTNGVENVASQTGKMLKELDEKTLQLTNGHYQANGKRIINIADPHGDKHAVNKRYLEQNALVLNGESYDSKNKRIINLAHPTSALEASNKNYVDSRIHAMTKVSPDPYNALFRYQNGLFVQTALYLSFDVYNAKSKRITNLKNTNQ